MTLLGIILAIGCLFWFLTAVVRLIERAARNLAARRAA